MLSICIKKIWSIIFLGIIFSATADAQGFLKTDGQRIVNEKGGNVLLRGIGLGGWMLQEGYMLKIYRGSMQYKIRQRIDSLIGPSKTQEFYDAWLANHTTKTDIDSLKSWGFNSVRLPIHYNLFTLPVDQEKDSATNTWLTKGFALTDSLLSWCRSDGIYLILDLHAAPAGQGNDLNIADRDGSKPSLWQSEAAQKKMIALWKKLAERYVNEPWIGGYDIINEPNWGFDDLANDKNGIKEQHNAPLKKLMIEITNAIRAIDKKHIIIIEGNGWGNNYKGILPPWDNNMVLSFHKYWNFNDPAAIKNMLEARNTYNVPIWIGETGENSNVWYTQAIQLFEKNNIGWAWWPLKKIGNNNPLEIKTNANYDNLINYFNGNGAQPSATDAYKGLMQLAADAKAGAAVFHKDVIDAIFRQPFSNEAIPFQPNRIFNNAIINAVDYDLGINGTAYFDNDTADYHVSNNIRGKGNKGGVYRNDGVDISKDSSGNYYVSSIEQGEWLQYTVDVQVPGNYSIKIGLSKNKGQFSITVDGKSAVNAIDLSLLPDDNKWQPVATGPITLQRGKHVIRLQVDKGGFNFKGMEFLLQ
jgi:aryl-phospho-beta-D-glucosidase BglC (GH1 family)